MYKYNHLLFTGSFCNLVALARSDKQLDNFHGQNPLHLRLMAVKPAEDNSDFPKYASITYTHKHTTSPELPVLDRSVRVSTQQNLKRQVGGPAQRLSG